MKIKEVSNHINSKARSGPGGFVVTSPTIAEQLDEMLQREHLKEKKRRRNKIIEKILKNGS